MTEPKPRPEIGSDAWIAERIARGLPPEETDRPTPREDLSPRR